MEMRTIGSHVGTLSRLLLKRINEKVLTTGLTGSQLSVIRLLTTGSLTQKEICDNLSIEASTGSTMIHSMENSGWVSRTVDEKDKREKKVELTERSKDYLPIWFEMSKKMHQHAFGSIPMADVDVFERVLTQMILNLKNDPK